MKIDKTMLDALSARAAASPRLRMNLDMRNSAEDRSQRMLNALEPGTELPIHRHRGTSETVIIVRGSAVQYIYDDNGNETERIYIKAGSDCVGMSVPAGVWHRMESLEPETVIFESKDGAYAPISVEDIIEQ